MSSKTKVSEGGRIVLPKKIRDRFGIEKGESIEVGIEGKRIVLKPEKTEDKPVEKLYSSIETEPEESPKKEARNGRRKGPRKTLHRHEHFPLRHPGSSRVRRTIERYPDKVDEGERAVTSSITLAEVCWWLEKYREVEKMKESWS